MICCRAKPDIVSTSGPHPSLPYDQLNLIFPFPCIKLSRCPKLAPNYSTTVIFPDMTTQQQSPLLRNERPHSRPHSSEIPKQRLPNELLYELVQFVKPVDQHLLNILNSSERLQHFLLPIIQKWTDVGVLVYHIRGLCYSFWLIMHASSNWNLGTALALHPGSWNVLRL